ncbi:Transcriptional regulatory protein ZraR [Anatilimnocola aggregata]|uniref:DNA-binding transcriptional regulator NtrC n=1 Tax=Anatilimnocola aggregata TaxID=2528021 RepID=A0A517Y6A3_9BACT|nr:sigma-54 dependent transcriptional regulator [Anatilimnocola aggregata]QDU25750.1 Transcriptional regulatory protein ZraR [Anatilimnocola aggregata]
MKNPNGNRLPRLLVVDDDPLVIRLAQSLFSDEQYSFLAARTGEQALQLLAQRPSVLILDNILPDMDGLAVLAEIRKVDPHLPVIFITARGTSQTAIEAMKRGAFDYLHKPLDLSVLEHQVQLALEARRLMHEPVVIAAERDATSEPTDALVGHGTLMSEVFKAIGRAASRDVPVLLQGEPGTGKALVARAIYQNSGRNTRPFRVLKCTDLDGPALEQELFGLDATGAGEQVGRLEQCDGGTLLLEEIAELTPPVQSKLFRLITTGSFERGNGGQMISTNVRLLCTTSQDLEPLVAQRHFRPDLYYALRALSITLPPLRQRREDLPALVDHFVQRFMHLSPQYNQKQVRVSSEAIDLLIEHSWPGNLDELQSVLQQTLIENTGTVLASGSLLRSLHKGTSSEGANPDQLQPAESYWQKFVAAGLARGSTQLYSEAIADMERHVVALVLTSTVGNQARAARILGITRGNLRKKLRALGLLPPSQADEALPDDGTATDADELLP